MPVSPTLAENLARPIIDAYLDTERVLLERIARSLAEGLDAPGWAERKLLEVQMLRRAAIRDLSDLDRRSAEQIAEAMYMASNRGSAAAVADLSVHAMPLAEAATPLEHPRGLQALIAKAQDGARSTHLRILRSTLDAYRAVVADTAGAVLTGAQTRRDAAQAALDRFAARGVTGFIDAAGRSWDMASYVEMSMRATTGQAAVTGAVDRFVAAGQDLVIVSDAPQECDVCRPWEGAVLSLSGATVGAVNEAGAVEVAGTLAQARDAGLFHPGCRHAVSLFQPGVTQPMRGMEDAEGAEARQQLRAMERRLRSWKRREAAALDDAAAARASAKVREWQGRIREHTESTSAKRQPHREQIGRAI